jgi:metallo-beta-lactamase class B
MFLAATVLSWSQQTFSNADWTAPFPAHRIIGPVYYVGTADLACFLITTPKGHILINTGVADSGPMIRKSIEALGFKPGDIRILLTNQAHFDHVAALAEFKKLTGAKFLATEADKPVLEDGGRSDFFLSGEQYRFAPIKVDQVLKDGEAIKLGNVELRTHLMPGHTKGSVGYSMKIRKDGKDYNVLFANMASVIGAKLIGNEKYPSIAADIEKSFRLQRAMAVDVFLAAHGSHYSLKEKYKPTYSPRMFVDPEGYKKAIASFEQRYQDQLRTEQAKLR